MVGQVNTPAGGVPWEVFTPSQRQYIEQYSAEYGIPVQVMMNALWQESGTGSIIDGTARLDPYATGAPGVAGIAQINMNNTGPGLGVTDPYNEEQSIRGLARGLAVYGTGGTIGNSWEETRMGTGPLDINRGVVFYNLGPGRPANHPNGPSGGTAWELSGRTLLPEETRNYQDSLMRGVTGYNPRNPLESFVGA